MSRMPGRLKEVMHEGKNLELRPDPSEGGPEGFLEETAFLFKGN